MECFIKKIFQNRVDKEVHDKFVRFGRGRYEGRAILSLHKSSKVKLKGSFEFANDFVNLVSELGEFSFSGVVLSKDKLELENEKKKAGVYSYEVSGLTSEKIKELRNKVYYFLLNVDSPELKLKIKKRLPKPGKSGAGKIDEKFCQLEADLKHYEKIRQAFFWDVPECKKCKVEHIYEITGLIIPEGEKDFEELRLKTKRKGKIIRKLAVDKKENIMEMKFEA